MRASPGNSASGCRPARQSDSRPRPRPAPRIAGGHEERVPDRVDRRGRRM